MMRLNRRCIWVAALLLVLPLGARAASIETESLELDGSFAFEHYSISVDGGGDFGVTIFNIDGGLGYFFNPNWELIGSLLINHESADDFGTTGFGLQATGRYHFNTTGSVIPFVGLGFGFVANGGDGPDATTAIIPEITGGIRCPFKNIVSFNFGAGYRHRTSPYGLEDTSSNDFFLGAGFSVFLRGGIDQ